MYWWSAHVQLMSTGLENLSIGGHYAHTRHVAFNGISRQLSYISNILLSLRFMLISRQWCAMQIKQISKDTIQCKRPSDKDIFVFENDRNQQLLWKSRYCIMIASMSWMMIYLHPLYLLRIKHRFQLQYTKKIDGWVQTVIPLMIQWWRLWYQYTCAYILLLKYVTKRWGKLELYTLEKSLFHFV